MAGCEFAKSSEQLGRPLDRKGCRAAKYVCHSGQADLKRGHDTEVVTGPAQRPEQVGLVFRGGGEQVAVGRHQFGSQQVVGREAVRRESQPTPPPSV